MAGLLAVLGLFLWVVLWCVAAWYLFAVVLPGKAKSRDSGLPIDRSRTAVVYWCVVVGCSAVLVVGGVPVVLIIGVVTGLIPRDVMDARF